MRVLAILALSAFAASAYFAPAHYLERPRAPSERGLIELDAQTRIEAGEEQRALGIALGGYLDRIAANPDDVDAVRGSVRTAIILWAVAVGQPELPDLVREQIQIYLTHRARVDPDGSMMQAALKEWVELRLQHPGFFYAHVSATIFLAARGEQRAKERLREYIKKGPLYTELFPYARRVHPRWEGIEEAVAHYLEKGDLAGRIEAAATLLDYNNLFAVGQELLDRHRIEILRDLKEGKSRLRRGGDPRFEGLAPAVLFGLAMYGPQGAKALKTMREADYNKQVDLLRIAQIWAGNQPLSRFKLGGVRWQLLGLVAQEYYFRACVHRWAKLKRAGAARDDPDLVEARELAEAGLMSQTTVISLYCFMGLASNDEEYSKKLVPRLVRGGGVPSIFAAVMKPQPDPLAVLLPGVSSPAPDYSALAAVSLLEMDGPPPLPDAK